VYDTAGIVTTPVSDAAVSRRRFLHAALGSASVLLLAACGQAASPSPTAPAAQAPTAAASKPAAATPAAGAGATPAAGQPAQKAPASFAGRQLTATGFGGTTQDLFQKVAFDPFDQATGAKTTQVPLQSADGFARMRAEKGNPQIDLFQFSGGQELLAKQEGLTETLTTVPTAADLGAMFKDPQSQWVATAVIAEGILYNTDKIKDPPASYNDFLKPDYQGHVAFPALSNSYGVDFLVMLARANGGGETNIDPGFDAMKKISEKATIFKAAAEVPTLFSQGDIWIMPYDASNAFRARDSGLPVGFATPKEGSPAVFITAQVAKGSKNADVAQAAIDYVLQPNVQAAIAQGLRWAPVNPKAQLPPDVAKDVPSGEEGLKKLVVLDHDTITAQRPDWTDRFNREIAK
jgi:putative spermidine/putrescine transport system substrate-binding protein